MSDLSGMLDGLDGIDEVPDANVDGVESEGTTDEGDQGLGAPATFDWNERASDLVTVTVNGAPVVMTVQEAMSSAMRQSDYTHKTQELAVQREQLGRVGQIIQALDADPAATLSLLAQLYGSPSADAEAEDVDPAEARLRVLEARETARQQEAQQNAVVNEAKAAIAAHGLADVDSEQLLQFAVDNQIGNLGAAARLMKAERVEAKRTANEAVIAAKRAAAVVAGGSSRAPGGTAPEAPRTIAESYALALKQHNTA